MNEVLFVVLGAFLGVFTGLIPGIHTNTLAAFALFLGFMGELNLSLMVVSMSVVHSFVDFVPSIALGAPDSESFLSVLPGHRLLLKGLGNYAIQLTAIGGLFGGLIALGFSPFYLSFLLQFREMIYFAVPFVLLAVIGLMAWFEEGVKGKFYALVVIALSGALGLIVLQGSISIRNEIFPLVTGFFAFPTILFSLREKTVVPKQKKTVPKFYAKNSFLHSFLSSLGGGIVSIFPAIGANQAAFILRVFLKKMRTSSYLVLLGGINTANMVFSFFMLYALGKTRTGSAVVLKQLIEVTPIELLLVFFAVLFALGFGVLSTFAVGGFVVRNMKKIAYRTINVAVLFALILLVLALSGPWGLAVSFVAASTGMLAVSAKVKRTNCMGFLMVPVIVSYLI